MSVLSSRGDLSVERDSLRPDSAKLFPDPVLTLQREEVRNKKLLGLGAEPVGEHGFTEDASVRLTERCKDTV